MVDFGLNEKVALVTGASRGIGAAIAQGFAEAGARVVLCARKQEGLDGVAGKIIQAGGEAIPIACHTGKTEAIDALFERIQADCGKLDILVNNAATNPYFGPAVDIPEGALDKTIEVNIKGYYLTAQRAAKMMIDGGSGSIVNIASIAGITPGPFQAIYSMTKAAVINMTKAFARELGSQGIRSNAIAPGVVETRFAKMLIETPEIYRQVIEQIPMKRHAQPSEIVGAALYLASDASSFTNGSVIVCDGAATA